MYNSQKAREMILFMMSFDKHIKEKPILPKKDIYSFYSCDDYKNEVKQFINQDIKLVISDLLVVDTPDGINYFAHSKYISKNNEQENSYMTEEKNFNWCCFNDNDKQYFSNVSYTCPKLSALSYVDFYSMYWLANRLGCGHSTSIKNPFLLNKGEFEFSPSFGEDRKLFPHFQEEKQSMKIHNNKTN